MRYNREITMAILERNVATKNAVYNVQLLHAITKCSNKGGKVREKFDVTSSGKKYLFQTRDNAEDTGKELLIMYKVRHLN